MENINYCPLCRKKNFNFLFEGQDRMHGIKGKFKIYRCIDCSLVFINPQPSFKELVRHYPKKKYYSFLQKKQKITIRSQFLDFLYLTYFSDRGTKFFKLIFFPLRSILRTTRIIPGKKFLDVGCGSGQFLLKMKGFGMDCYGVEPGEFQVGFAEKYDLKIFKGTLLDAEYPTEYFDVITLNHVFEHLPNPSETLEELHRTLKPGGTVIIAVPNINSLAYKIFKDKWVQLDPPRHLFSYSDTTLRKFAEKTGFKVLKLRYNSHGLQFLGSLLYVLNMFRSREVILAESNFVRNKIANFVLRPLSGILNSLKLGDQIEMVLTK